MDYKQIEEKVVQFYKEKKVLFFGIVGVLVLLIVSQIANKKEEKSDKAISWKVGGKDANRDSVSVAKVNGIGEAESNSNYDVVSEQSGNSGYQSKSSANNELDYLDKLDKQDISTPKQSASSTYSPYGNYDMWQEKEPSNSRIGYSSKKRPAESSTYSNTPTYTEVYKQEPIKEASYMTNGYEEKKAPAAVLTQVKSKLISQGYATNNRSVSFVLLESFSLNGETISKGKSYATGVIKIDNNRILARITTIKANGKTYNVAGKILGHDGEDGLPLVVNENSSSNGNGNIIRDEAANQASRIPIVGGIISRASSNYGNTTRESKIPLSNIECQIVILK